MTLTITYHIPLKAKFNKKDLSCSIYIPFKKWLWGHGGWGKAGWVRILGLTIWVSYWTMLPIECSFRIQ